MKGASLWRPSSAGSARAGRSRGAWRDGGRRTGRRDSETCDSKEIARRFKALVEAAGEHRPEGCPKGAAAEPQPDMAAPALGEVVSGYLSKLKKADARQIAPYGGCSISMYALRSSR